MVQWQTAFHHASSAVAFPPWLDTTALVFVIYTQDGEALSSFLMQTCEMNYPVTRFRDILQEHTRTSSSGKLSSHALLKLMPLVWETGKKKLLFNPSVFRMYSTWLCGINQSINISSFFSSFSSGFKMNIMVYEHELHYHGRCVCRCRVRRTSAYMLTYTGPREVFLISFCISAGSHPDSALFFFFLELCKASLLLVAAWSCEMPLFWSNQSVKDWCSLLLIDVLP